MVQYAYSYAKIGKAIVDNGWGLKTTKNIDACIKSLSNVDMTICLMSAIVSLLNESKAKAGQPGAGQQEITPPKASERNRARTDGQPEESLIDVVAQSRLSTRASKVLARSNYRTIDDIKPEQLLEMKNCGIGTVREIMAWVDEQKSKACKVPNPVPAEVHEGKPVGVGVESCNVTEAQL